VRTAPLEVEELYVWGRRPGEIGVAVSASQGQVLYGAFAKRPLLRPGELGEVVPGLAATQHSGSGKANQYFLRGFNLDHGTDFSVDLDGVPLNLRTHAHGQGYLDVNGVIPELIEAISYRKGPYYPSAGDFSAAGTAAFRSFERLPENFVKAQAGENGFGRLVAGLNVGSGLVGVELASSDGPWLREENLRKTALLARIDLGDWSITALGYDAKWDATDQIPRRAVDAGLLSRLGTVDETDGGRTSRLILSARRDLGRDGGLVLYAQRYDVNLWSNFTYFLDDPHNGDQFEQAEERWILGGSANHAWRPARAWTFRYGGEARLDLIEEVGLYRTRQRERISTEREDRVKEASGAIWGSASWEEGPLRASFGLRGDVIYADVRSNNPLNSDDASDVLFSPKATLAWRVSEALELYANAGRGFHSNDMRGAVQRVAPMSLEPIARVPLFAAADGAEFGARYERGGLVATLALWTLKLESELVYIGDAGVTQPADGTMRSGIELLVSWTPRPGLSLEASSAATEARYRNDPEAGDRIPNALEYVVTAGVTARLTPNSSAQLTLRRLGPAPLVEDGSVWAPSSTIVNLGYTYNLERFTVFADVLNLLRSEDNDITYFYASRLPNEPSEGVEDVHFHPIEPRQVRVGVRLQL